MSDALSLSRREVKRRLRRKGITQEQAARVAGVGQPFINNLLHGRKRSRRVLEILKRLAS